MTKVKKHGFGIAEALIEKYKGTFEMPKGIDFIVDVYEKEKVIIITQGLFQTACDVPDNRCIYVFECLTDTYFLF